MTSLYWGTKANAFACSLRHSFHFDMYLRDWSVVLLTLFSLESISFFFFSAAMEKMTTQWHRQPHFSTSKGISIFVRSALPFFFCSLMDPEMSRHIYCAILILKLMGQNTVL